MVSWSGMHSSTWESLIKETVELVFYSNKFFIFCEQKYVADFYISDFQSGLRAIVKAGYGAKVAPFVKPTTVVDVTKENRELSPNFLSWLADRKLSSDDRIMRLKEGYGLHYSIFSTYAPAWCHFDMGKTWDP